CRRQRRRCGKRSIGSPAWADSWIAKGTTSPASKYCGAACESFTTCWWDSGWRRLQHIMYKVPMNDKSRAWEPGVLALDLNTFPFGAVTRWTAQSDAQEQEKAMARKYGEKAQKTVKEAMHKYKHGDLKSGKSGHKVKNRKQAVAIGLSEARKKGAKVPAKSKSGA